VSAALLMIELALTRGFSVTMYYHLAFLAISSEDLGFSVLYAPSLPAPSSAEDPVEMRRTGTSAADYRRLILASNRQQFLSSYLAQLVDAGVAWTLPARIAFAVMLIAPVGVLLGTPMPGGMRPIAADRADIIPWAWGINGAFSVVGATLAVFTAMNWGFSVTLLSAAVVYALAALTLWRA